MPHARRLAAPPLIFHCALAGVAWVGPGVASSEAASAPSSSPRPADDRQAEPGWDARFGLGLALPAFSPRFAGDYDPGYQLGVELGHQFGDAARYHVAIAVYHSRMFLNETSFAASSADSINARLGDGAALAQAANVSAEGGAVLGNELFGQLRWDLRPGALRPYLLGGAGLALSYPLEARYRADESLLARLSGAGDDSYPVTGALRRDSEWAPLLTAGVGFTDTAGPFGLYAQARASWVPFTERRMRFVSVTVGAEL